MPSPQDVTVAFAPVAIVALRDEQPYIQAASPAFAKLRLPVCDGDADTPATGKPLRGGALRFEDASYERLLGELREGAPVAELIGWRLRSADPGAETISQGVPHRLLFGAIETESAEPHFHVTAEPYGISVDGGARDGRLFGQIVEHSPDIIAVIDRKLRHVYVNGAILEAAGTPAEDFVGRDHHELGMPEELVEYFQSVYRGVFESGEEGSKEFEFPAPDGTMHTFVSRVVPLVEGDGETRVLLSFARDITERRAAENARLELERKMQETQRLESLGLLAGGIAHDFNNILTSILGMASLARNQADDASRDRALEQIERSCVKAADLCNQMLAYAGRGRTKATHLDMGSLIRETQDLVHGSVPDKVSVRVELPDETLMTSVDRAQLQQVTMNLLLNAVEAYDGCGGEVVVRASRRPHVTDEWAAAAVAPTCDGGDLVCVEFEDRGPGMNEETLARVFEPFFTTKFAGRGLGLAATLGIVRAHGGGLAVQSTPGEGTLFTLALPAAPVTDAEAEDEGRTTIPTPGGTHVLIVDDEVEVREAASLMTQALGYDASLKEDGVSALECFEASDPGFDVVLLDLTMPQMNGFELLRRIRERHPHLPAVLMSGYVESDIRERADSDDAVTFLQKPFTMAQLDEALSAARMLAG